MHSNQGVWIMWGVVCIGGFTLQCSVHWIRSHIPGFYYKTLEMATSEAESINTIYLCRYCVYFQVNMLWWKITNHRSKRVKIMQIPSPSVSLSQQGLHPMHICAQQNRSDLHRGAGHHLQGAPHCAHLSPPPLELRWPAGEDVGLPPACAHVRVVNPSFHPFQWDVNGGEEQLEV